VKSYILIACQYQSSGLIYRRLDQWVRFTKDIVIIVENTMKALVRNSAPKVALTAAIMFCGMEIR